MTTVAVSTEKFISTFTLDRPNALNAFSAQLMDDLADAFIAATADDSVRVVVLTGAGRAFSAGADLSEMGKKSAPPKHGLDGLLHTIIDFPKPLLLAVNGLGVGIGATICGLADLVFMAESARLRCPFSALGLTAEASSTYTFTNLMGRQQASWFLLAAEWMSAIQCVEVGLALKVLPDERLLDEVYAHASKLAALPLASLQTTKALMMAPHKDGMKLAVRREGEGLAKLVGGAANREALKAFQEKREPDFSHL